MQKSVSTLRVPVSIWEDDGNFEEMLGMLRRYRAGFDRVMLFQSFTHAPLSLETVSRRAEGMKRRLPELRRAGFGAGINLLAMVGFFPENLEDIPRGIPHYVRMDGAVNQGSFCHNNDSYRTRYLVPLLEILASAEPDFIWFDDDNRGNCCCDACIADFNRRYGTELTREELRRTVDEAPAEEKLSMRRKFLRFSAESLARHYRFAAETLYRLNPRIEIGGMDICGNFSEEMDFEAWCDALAGPAGHPVRWRPGGGSYTDREPEEFIFRKGVLMGMDAALMPERLSDREAEVENFTYQRLKKSRRATVFEAAVYNAFGMTGTAWNIFESNDPLSVYDSLFREIAAARPFFDAQVRADGLAPLRGIWNGWKRDAGALMMQDGGTWDYRWYGNIGFNAHSGEIFASGLPWAFTPENAEVTILNRDTAGYLDEETLLGIFRRGLYCDAGALQELEKRGFGRFLGFRTAGHIDADMRERLTDHPLNGQDAGRFRDCRQSFTHQPGWRLEAAAPGCEILAELIDYSDRTAAPCTMGIFRNELGGRVCVAGYYPFTELQFAYKIGQIKNVFKTFMKISDPIQNLFRLCKLLFCISL